MVSRVNFPSVMRLHERIIKEIIVIQRDPARGECCRMWCWPELRATFAGCNFLCAIVTYCFGHVNDHLETTMDKVRSCCHGSTG